MQRTASLLVLLAALAACGDGQSLIADADGDGIPDGRDPDSGGGDGLDTDGDGIPDDQDADDDNDGTADGDEADRDGDGIIDDRDSDDDNDGIPDDVEPDADGDGIINDDDPDDDNDGIRDEDEGGGVDGGALPPGTDNPTSDESITRYEALNDAGGGYVTDVAYDAATDTFSVDNLAFDGDNVYTRDDDVPTLSSEASDAVYAVYEANPVEFDDDGTPIGQFAYRAIYGVSANTVTVDGEEVPASQFAIVRTGSYVGYGFGGFIYERNGGVELPTTGQAAYEGEYAGVRVFEGRGGLEYTRGEVDIAIDFRDFNAGSGVQGTISNREAFDINGDPIPMGGEGELLLPDLTFAVGPGTVTGDGEMTNALSSYTEEGGAVTTYETGSYYAIIGGEDAGEIVGVFVVESQDPRFSGVTAQETGGFIVYR